MTFSQPQTSRHSSFEPRRYAVLERFGGKPFTPSQAYVAGLSRSDLLSPSIRHVRHGVYVDARIPPSFELDCAALMAVAPTGSRIAGESAARLQNLPAPTGARMCLSVPATMELRRRGVLVIYHPAHEYGAEVASRFGPLAVSSVGQILPEVVQHLTLIESVEIADSILARHPTSIEMMREQWLHMDGPRGRLLRDVAAFAAARVESPAETRTRLLLVMAGFGCPITQHEVLLDGRVRRFDLAYPDLKIAIEYDGAHHFMTEERKHDDAIRRDAATRAGWIVISVVPYGIYRDPAGTIHRVAEAFRSRGARVILEDDWRRHFVQRV